MVRAHLSLDPHRAIGAIDPRLFGSFVEHLGRCVYDGIYEPDHPLADADGFRTDVLDLVRELGVTTVRYPGGNFVSGFRWEDGVGPRQDRPRRVDLAWHSTETNQVGLHEFAGWLGKLDAELMLAVNLGTRGVAEALDLLEYCNLPGGSTLSDRRAANGSAAPFNVKMWCLGNEMDGPWQLGHRSADEYGRLAARTARAMRQFDPDLRLVVCGSSGAGMPTFGSWEREVLEHAYDDVDYISCHAYYQERDGDLDSFLASAVDMDRFIDTVVSTADHVKALKRSDRTMAISFDEWNVWYLDTFRQEEKITGLDNWPVAPRLLENVYTVADAVVVGNMLISLLRHADRVTAASLAQLVNVIAPIMTEPGGPAWRQTTFHPFALTARVAGGVSLDVALDSDTHATSGHGTVPVVDAAAGHDAALGHTSMFLVNRHTTLPATVTVDTRALGDVRVTDARTLTDPDVRAANTLADQNRVTLAPLAVARGGDGVVTLELPPVSWSAVTLSRP